MNLFTEAQRYIAGGVNSPVRAFAAVGGDPIFIKSARGAWLTTEDGRQLIDYVGSWGPMILGHAHPAVIDAVQSAAERGLNAGYGKNPHGQFRHGSDDERDQAGAGAYRA